MVHESERLAPLGLGELKENRKHPAPGPRWLCAAFAICALTLGLAALPDASLPEPRPADERPDLFSGVRAHRHLVNLTSIGPRVAGSYENEVVAVRVLLEALRGLRASSLRHNALRLDLHTASGGFPLTFFDGMNNVYRDVQSVVALVGATGGQPRGRRSALLLNCHFDTVPDSPGASDDGAGCAVVLETLRALLATPHPLRHDVIALFNGAEENIMQASHAFVTTHRWAKSVRTFINVEACGAGGREVLFQAGPRDPWLVELYASTAPRPFASSLAQELFESGAVPADTDFRIFRDFGGLSGVDLAWIADGYVYHTRLDTHRRVPPSALQHTGDNVLALVHGLLASESLESEVDPSAGQPVFFDVLGLCVVCARPGAAAATALAVVALALLALHLDAGDAARQLYVRRAAWARVVGRALAVTCAAHLAGAAAAVGVAALLHLGGARIAFYSRPWLLAPLYAGPALCVSSLTALRLGRSSRGVGALVRGWTASRAYGGAALLASTLLLALCAARGLRAGFVPLLWALPAAGATLAGRALRLSAASRAALACAAAAPPALQTWYLAVGSLGMFVPIAGRAGSPPLPVDVLIAALVAALVLTACGWTLPLVVAADPPRRPIALALGACLAVAAAVACGAASPPYSAERPQRVMVFHTRRTDHARGGAAENLFWIPALDGNTPASLYPAVPELREARAVSAGSCAALYCGAPYYLPVTSLVSTGYELPAPAAPLARLDAALTHHALNDTSYLIRINVTGPAHVVVVVAPAPGARLARCNLVDGAPLAGPPWRGRRTYFLALHAARASARSWLLDLHLEHSFASPPARWADLSLAGHSQAGPEKEHPAHARLLRRLPAWVAPTGWGVDLHLHAVRPH